MTPEWPKVIDEFRTVDELLKGRSIARYGDGELKLCFMRDCVSQVANRRLADELVSILEHYINPVYSDDLMVGLPYLAGGNEEFWKKIVTKRNYLAMLRPDRDYYSAFITRPDNAPHINVASYWQKIEALWYDKEVVLVAGSDRSLTPNRGLNSARKITLIPAPYRDAYSEIDELEKAVKQAAQDEQTVILCVGPTATCLAHRLYHTGVQALDLGHIGKFWNGRNLLT